MKIPYVDLGFKNRSKKNYLKIFDKILDEGQFVGGKEISKFEKNISKLCKTKFAVSLNSGTDALTMALHLLGIRKGDEVITPPNSFIASTSVIVHLGAKPVFVDVKDDQNIDPNLIERAITNKTKAIMPVHLCGRVAEMDKIMEIAKKYNLRVIEDAAQSIGSKFENKMSGSIGDVGCFSAHPLKNLSALGDSGYLTTNDKKIYLKIKSLVNHGIENRNKVNNFGYVSRMDNLQAAFLNFKLLNLDNIIFQRRKNAKIYLENLNLEKIKFVKENQKEFHTYHTFVIQVNKRDELKKYLLSKGIGSAIHYPIPIHKQPAYKKLGIKPQIFKKCEKQSKTILSIPINEYLKKKEIIYICNTINRFFKT